MTKMAVRIVKEIHSTPDDTHLSKRELNRELVKLEKEQKSAILYNLPDKYRASGGKLLEKIWPFIDLTEENRILYPSSIGEEEMGSNIISLLEYVLLENAPKPPDVKKFLRILQMAGVQKSQLSASTTVVSWNKMY